MSTTFIAVLLLAVVIGAVAVIWGYRRERKLEADITAVVAAYLGIDAAQVAPTGQPGQLSHEGRDYHYKVFRPGRNESLKFDIWLAAGNAGHAQIRRERSGDAAAKRIGLVREVQSGDEEFDRRFFIDSPEPLFAERLVADGDRRNAIKSIIDGGFDRVILDAGRVAAHNHDISSTPAGADRLPLAALLQNLATVAAGQSRIPPHLGADLRRAWRFRLGALYTVIGVVFVFGFAAMFVGFEYWLPLDKGSVFYYSLRWSLPAAIAWGVAVLLLLRGRSDTMYHLIIMAGLCLPAAVLAGFSGTMCVNGSTDTSSAKIYTPQVVDRYVNRGRHGTSYYAIVKSWRRGRRTERFVISKHDYYAMEAGVTTAHVAVRAGALGFVWWEEARISNSPAPRPHTDEAPGTLPNFVR